MDLLRRRVEDGDTSEDTIGSISGENTDTTESSKELESESSDDSEVSQLSGSVDSFEEEDEEEEDEEESKQKVNTRSMTQMGRGAMRGTRRPVFRRGMFRMRGGITNTYHHHKQQREAYRQKLAEDPSFVPHIGTFWGHDDRFMPAGLRNRRPIRGGYRGRYFGRGFRRGRGGMRMMMPYRYYGSSQSRHQEQSSAVEEEEEPVEETEAQAEEDAGEEAAATAAAEEEEAPNEQQEANESKPTPARKPTYGIHTRWGHDGYEQLQSSYTYRGRGRGGWRGRGRGGVVYDTVSNACDHVCILANRFD
jgi:hypothetical protein